MRYYDKHSGDTGQHATASTLRHKLRLRARAFLFGRVTHQQVLWMGVALIVLIVSLSLWGLSNLANDDEHHLHDVASQLMIRR